MKGKIIQINALYVHWKLKEAMKKSADNITHHNMSYWKHFIDTHKISV